MKINYNSEFRVWLVHGLLIMCMALCIIEDHWLDFSCLGVMVLILTIPAKEALKQLWNRKKQKYVVFHFPMYEAGKANKNGDIYSKECLKNMREFLKNVKLVDKQ